MPPGEIDYVNFKDVFCDGAVCHTVIGGIPAYMDSKHITAPFARSLAARIDELITKNDPAKSHQSSLVSAQVTRDHPTHRGTVNKLRVVHYPAGMRRPERVAVAPCNGRDGQI